MPQTVWKRFELSSDTTHHVIDGQAAYPARFLSVLKFHEPGLAPAKNATGAFHINVQGECIYSHRFLQTFGFYENRAVVQADSGWYHILPDGTALYPNRYAWCGNYQQESCVVKDLNGVFFHIDLKGNCRYAQRFQYTGDFHDGYAVIQNNEGLHTHIDVQGNFLHGKWFIDLDVYHKGFARAKDQGGWFHINSQGLAIYPQRYKNIEHFYNGIARVETMLGALHRITENGETVDILRKELDDPFHQVSAELVGYWRYYTLQVASQVFLFDKLPNSLDNISQSIGLPTYSTCKLLSALKEIGFVKLDHDVWICTSKGEFLQSTNPFSLNYASRLWSEEHLICWSNILPCLKTGIPVFNQLFGKGWFDWLNEHPDKNRLYHKAIEIYAARDYRDICSIIDFSNHRSILDIGGSTGALLFNILEHNLQLEGVLLDLPNTIQMLKIPSHLKNRVRGISTDFFFLWPPLAVESVVLSRVLHDWGDQEAIIILKKIYSALTNKQDNRLYIIEKLQNENEPQGALLDLNMLIMTGGMERTLRDFDQLLRNAGFILDKVKPLNQVSSILIARKKI